MQTTILQTVGLTKRYKGQTAVDGVSMTLAKGDIYGFIGQNGAGKTTFLRMVSGLISPTGGEVQLFGQGAAGAQDAHKRMGCVIEGPAFYPRMTAEENLEYYRIQRGLPDKAIILEALEAVGLTGTGNKKYNQFSLGMKQRLGLALAIMAKPDLLLLDEPINGLDPMGIIEFREILHSLNEKYGMTILISSHILTELSHVATRFGIIHEGKLVRECTRAELEENCKKCLSLKVSDGPLAATVLERMLGEGSFEVLPGGEIRVYKGIHDPGEITFQLNRAEVRVLAATELGEDLESFYLETIGQQGGRA